MTKTTTKMSELISKPASELSARELNLVRRHQATMRSLTATKLQEAKITKAIEAAKEAHAKLASKQSRLVEKLRDVEQAAIDEAKNITSTEDE